jgi:peptidoglycan/xylan/chitin deacetylase (PgdA/CDA1 family)
VKRQLRSLFFTTATLLMILCSSLTASAQAASPATPVTPDHQTINVPILMYHRITYTNPGASLAMQQMSVSPAIFAAQMKYLSDRGYHAITIKQLYQHLDARHTGIYVPPLPTRPIVITFDDGYKTQYYNALPILNQYGFKATFYIIASTPGTADYMTWNMIKQLDKGGMDIESHTWDHKLLTVLSDAALTRELVDAKNELEKRLGHVVNGFCYPDGGYNTRVINAVAAAGYTNATIVAGGRLESYAKRFTLPRISVYGTFGFDFFTHNVYYP